DTPEITKCWLNSIGLADIEVSETRGLAARDREYDLLAEHFEKHIDTDAIIKILDLGENS
ncbi:MAG: cobyric acid synthase, partial [Deltaproteobacteria bacterium]